MPTEEEIRTARKEYHRKWRAEHPESVQAANIRFWSKKVEELKKAGMIPVNAEFRGENLN